jgi:hypothetical protein
MSQAKRVLVLALALGGWIQAQPPAGGPAQDKLLTTRFQAPLTYEAALTRLGNYYQEQVGRILPVAFPEIAPHCHFEVWHDVWVFFEPANGQTTVTLQRPTDGVSSHMVKSWMLDLAGRLDAAMPLEFKEEPPLHEAGADIYAGGSDLARALGPGSSLKPVATWEHAAVLVSAAPLTRIVLSPAGLHGVHHVAVSAENAAAAKQILLKLLQGVVKPGIYGAYSEEVELDHEVQELASGRSAAAGVSSSQAVYIPNMDQKYLENRVRAEPEMSRRLAAAAGQYAVRFRVDQSYRKVTVSLSELAGYVRPTGKYAGERLLGQSTLPNPRPAPQGGAPLTARTRLPVLAPGAYRVRLEGESAAGQTAKIDERTYWFDGKTFEEL